MLTVQEKHPAVCQTFCNLIPFEKFCILLYLMLKTQNNRKTELAVKKKNLKYINLKPKDLLLVIVGYETMGTWRKEEKSDRTNLGRK